MRIRMQKRKRINFHGSYGADVRTREACNLFFLLHGRSLDRSWGQHTWGKLESWGRTTINVHAQGKEIRGAVSACTEKRINLRADDAKSVMKPTCVKIRRKACNIFILHGRSLNQSCRAPCVRRVWQLRPDALIPNFVLAQGKATNNRGHPGEYGGAAAPGVHKLHR